MQRLGEQIAFGSRSVVHTWGSNAVAKVPLPSVPEGWIRFEALYTDAVYACGAPVPRLLGIDVAGGRQISIYERIEGPSMWEEVLRGAMSPAACGAALAEVHRRLFAIRPPISLPTQHSRLATKIFAAADAIDSCALDALPLLNESRLTPAAVSLCHGDLHPNNVILAARGPIVIDWFDASRGNAFGDIARTTLLLGAGHTGQDYVMPAHLPNGLPEQLRIIHDSYLQIMRAHFGMTDQQLAHWRAIEAAARMAEGVPIAPLLSVLDLTDQAVAARRS